MHNNKWFWLQLFAGEGAGASAGGEGGGEVVAVGTVAEVANNPKSITGHFLKEKL